MIIDTRGCACPEPVLKTKKGLTSNPDEVNVLVDNNTAKENVKRFATNQGYQVNIKEEGNDFLLNIKK